MRRYVFSDEAGDFDFSRKPNVSRYFIVCAVSMETCDGGLDLLKLRREMLWRGDPVDGAFHASVEKRSVRDQVFKLMAGMNFKVYAQIMEKSKAQPKTRVTRERFYQYAWYYLFKYGARRIVPKDTTEVMITAASIGTKKGQQLFTDAVEDVLGQTLHLKADKVRTVFCSAESDPCLQIADYCTWAIQRKWERGDSAAYDMIASKIEYEYDLWGHGTTHFY
jgi:hypothetical protein